MIHILIITAFLYHDKTYVFYFHGTNTEQKKAANLAAFFILFNCN
nr:MAG TPA: hypothetical protein [Caudoviricetes sp.]